MIYFKYIRMIMKSFLQYRAAVWLTFTGQFFISFFSFAGIWMLFQRFDNINVWEFGEVALCFAVINTSFALTQCFARGFDQFSHFIIKGEFDRILLRPRGTVMQILGSNFDIGRMGRVIQSFVVFVLALSWIKTDITPAKIITVILMIISGIVIFTGIFILGASICFFTVQGLEIVSIFTDGGREVASYPLSIYNKWIMRFFTFIIPFGCINYLPLMFVTGRAEDNTLLYMAAPLAGIFFILPCIWVWRYGVRHYLSTGS